MLAFVKQHFTPLVVSVMLHVGLIALLSISIAGIATYNQRPAQLTVKATVVDEDLINQALADIEQSERSDAERQAAEQKRVQDQIDQARRQREDEQRKTEQARKQREAEEQAEQERIRIAKQERDRAEAERQRKIREEQEAERKRLADLERQRKEEEERVARLKAEREAEERRQREARAKAIREEQLRAELAAEQRREAAINAGKLDEYRAMITQKIVRNWNRPPSVTAGLECVLHVRQIPGGEVVDVRIGQCNADAAAQRSIEAAVYRSSPLPEPGDPSLFDRNLQITFRPQD